MKNNLLSILITTFLTSSSLFANFANTYNYDDVMTDFTAQNTEKYQKDNFKKLEPQTLIDQQIFRKQ